MKISLSMLLLYSAIASSAPALAQLSNSEEPISRDPATAMPVSGDYVTLKGGERYLIKAIGTKSFTVKSKTGTACYEFLERVSMTPYPAELQSMISQMGIVLFYGRSCKEKANALNWRAAITVKSSPNLIISERMIDKPIVFNPMELIPIADAKAASIK